MTAVELSDLGRHLGISLPTDYRSLHTEHSSELTESGAFDDEISCFFLDPDRVRDVNLHERTPNSGTADAFPNWWETFFLIGTDGGGGFYCLRLDGEPGVWMIGSDCGDEPERVAPTLRSFVDDRLNEHHAARQQTDRRERLYAAETTAETRAAAGTGDANATTWPTSVSPYGMFRDLNALMRKVSPRKLRLYGLACCDLVGELQADEECVAALKLAERMTEGEVDAAEVSALRDRLKQKFLAILERSESSPAGCWGVAAARNLLQDDQDHLSNAPIYAGDAELSAVWNAVNSATGASRSDDLADLLREVLGNPFVPVDWKLEWSAPEVVRLAREIESSREFARMPDLIEPLQSAGCADERVLSHCRRSQGHVRGSWVLDLILGRDPFAPEKTEPWDFQCQHGTIDGDVLKRRLAEFGASGSDDPRDPRAAVRFARWLADAGDAHWANYITARCRFDDQPTDDEYADALEHLRECAAAADAVRMNFDEFYFSGYRLASDEWWEGESDDLEWGLPSHVMSVSPGDGPGPVARLIPALQALIDKTPVRGVDFEQHYANELGTILASPGGRRLKSIRLSNGEYDAETAAAIAALVASPVAPHLERLHLDSFTTRDGNVTALADAPFERLAQLVLTGYRRVLCSPAAADRLLTSAWFRRLRYLSIGLDSNCGEATSRHLADMPKLHSLDWFRPLSAQAQALTAGSSFPALRRFALRQARFDRNDWRAVAAWQLPRLIDLWLQDCAGTQDDIRTLAESAWFGGLKSLTLAGPIVELEGLRTLAGAACAKTLRVLRLHCGGSDCVGRLESLANTPLVEPGAFPELTTLQIEYPFAKNATRDTARFLESLATPKLRHLTLKDCDFDDRCAAAIQKNPAFRNLTRLAIHQGYHATSMLTPEASQSLLRSEALRGLIELELHNFAVDDALACLEDEQVLPRLARAAFWGTNASKQTAARLKAKRPRFHIGS